MTGILILTEGSTTSPDRSKLLACVQLDWDWPLLRGWEAELESSQRLRRAHGPVALPPGPHTGQLLDLSRQILLLDLIRAVVEESQTSAAPMNDRCSTRPTYPVVIYLTPDRHPRQSAGARTGLHTNSRATTRLVSTGGGELRDLATAAKHAKARSISRGPPPGG